MQGKIYCGYRLWLAPVELESLSRYLPRHAAACSALVLSTYPCSFMQGLFPAVPATAAALSPRAKHVALAFSKSAWSSGFPSPRWQSARPQMGGSSATRVFVPALQPPTITATVTAEIGITRMPITSKFGLADLCRVISPSSASAHTRQVRHSRSSGGWVRAQF